MTAPDPPRRRAQDHQPRWLLPILIVLIILGSVSVVTTIQTARAEDIATRADVDEVQQLVDQIADMTRQSATDRAITRERTEAAHTTICAAVVSIAVELGVTVPACPPPLHDSES